jgi:hypothetical protein
MNKAKTEVACGRQSSSEELKKFCEIVIERLEMISSDLRDRLEPICVPEEDKPQGPDPDRYRPPLFEELYCYMRRAEQVSWRLADILDRIDL